MTIIIQLRYDRCNVSLEEARNAGASGRVRRDMRACIYMILHEDANNDFWAKGVMGGNRLHSHANRLVAIDT